MIFLANPSLSMAPFVVSIFYDRARLYHMLLLISQGYSRARTPPISERKREKYPSSRNTARRNISLYYILSRIYEQRSVSRIGERSYKGILARVIKRSIINRTRTRINAFAFVVVSPATRTKSKLVKRYKYRTLTKPLAIRSKCLEGPERLSGAQGCKPRGSVPVRFLRVPRINTFYSFPFALSLLTDGKHFRR